MADQTPLTYLPDDLAAINALQKRINEYAIPTPYSQAEQDKIMKGRRKQDEIDQGRQTIAARQAQIERAQADIRGMNDQLAGLKRDAAERFKGWNTQQAQSEATQRANRAQDEAAQTIKDYRGGTLGTVMQGIDAAAPFSGIPFGEVEARGIRLMQERNEAALNAERQKQAAAYDAVKRGSPAAQGLYESIPATAKASGLIPRAPGAARAARYLPYAAVGVPLALEGAAQRFLFADQPGNTPFESDAWRDSGTAMMATGAYGLAKGLGYSANPRVVPDSEALRKIYLAEQAARDLANRPVEAKTPPAPPTEAAAPLPEIKAPLPPAPRGPGLAPYEGTPGTVAARLWRDLGGDPKTVTLKDRLKGLPVLIDKASDDAATAAAHLAGFRETTDPRQALRTFTQGALTERKPIKAIPRVGAIGAIAAPTAAAMLAGSSDSANAAPQGSEESGLHYAARRAYPYLDAATYAIPYAGEARMGADVGLMAAPEEKSVIPPAPTPRRVNSDVPPLPPHAGPDEQMQRGYQVAALERARAEDRRQQQELYERQTGTLGTLNPLAPPQIDTDLARLKAVARYLGAGPSAHTPEGDPALARYLAGKGPPEGEPPASGTESVPPAVRQFASGGGVKKNASLHALKTKLSAMQQELQNALSTAVKHAGNLSNKKGASRQAEKVHSTRDNIISDIWALHNLSKKVISGQVRVHHNISKKEMIALARQHDEAAAQAS